MDIFERKQKILEILNREGKVRVNELSALFEISDVTIRMDLADLEAKGLLSRVHGGAVSSYKTYYNMDMQQRLSANQPQKQAIAQKIVDMIDENDTIMLNAGTTTLTLFRMIPPKINLCIVTNSIAIALEAGSNPNFNVVLLGGFTNAKHQFTYGDDAITQLEKYHADKLILSVDGISQDNGLTTYYSQEVELARMMLSRAATKIIAADATKLGRTAFAKIADISAADYIITTEHPSTAEDAELLKSNVQNFIMV
ncbi:MAG: DeoR/GlpR transcriptional regulator [Lachnospiraceae bacterium]|nr:DeoR/GlpR transcriptional regulator [Lachnospiraceae bacterium]MBR3761810.1 DeoR/GlpR transcriptional regulator [Lachnospiraceae bacterium]